MAMPARLSHDDDAAEQEDLASARIQAAMRGRRTRRSLRSVSPTISLIGKVASLLKSIRIKRMAELPLAVDRMTCVLSVERQSELDCLRLWEQGDAAMHTREACAQRYANRTNKEVWRWLNKWWDSAMEDEPEDEELMREHVYVAVMMNVCKALLDDGEEWDEAEARRLSTDAWDVDSGGRGHLTRTEFNDSMFELVDMWTLTPDPKEYCGFLDNMARICFDGKKKKTPSKRKRKKFKAAADASRVPTASDFSLKPFDEIATGDYVHPEKASSPRVPLPPPPSPGVNTPPPPLAPTPVAPPRAPPPIPAPAPSPEPAAPTKPIAQPSFEERTIRNKGHEQRREATKIQAFMRKKQAKGKFKKQKAAATMIQAYARGSAARKEVKAMRKAAAAEPSGGGFGFGSLAGFGLVGSISVASCNSSTLVALLSFSGRAGYHDCIYVRAAGEAVRVQRGRGRGVIACLHNHDRILNGTVKLDLTGGFARELVVLQYVQSAGGRVVAQSRAFRLPAFGESFSEPPEWKSPRATTQADEQQSPRTNVSMRRPRLAARRFGTESPVEMAERAQDEERHQITSPLGGWNSPKTEDDDRGRSKSPASPAEAYGIDTMGRTSPMGRSSPMGFQPTPPYPVQQFAVEGYGALRPSVNTASTMTCFEYRDGSVEPRTAPRTPHSPPDPNNEHGGLGEETTTTPSFRQPETRLSPTPETVLHSGGRKAARLSRDSEPSMAHSASTSCIQPLAGSTSSAHLNRTPSWPYKSEALSPTRDRSTRVSSEEPPAGLVSSNDPLRPREQGADLPPLRLPKAGGKGAQRFTGAWPDPKNRDCSGRPGGWLGPIAPLRFGAASSPTALRFGGLPIPVERIGLVCPPQLVRVSTPSAMRRPGMRHLLTQSDPQLPGRHWKNPLVPGGQQGRNAGCPDAR